MRWGPISWWIILLWYGSAGAFDLNDQRRIEAALSDGRASQVLFELRNMPDRHQWGRARLAYIHTLQVLKRWDQAWAELGVHQSGHMEAPWSAQLRGAVWQRVGDHYIAQNKLREARRAFAAALHSGGDSVAVDRCLLLIGECAFAQGDRELARTSVERVWWGWRQSPYRFQAGILLARLFTEVGDERGLEVMAELSLQREVAPERQLLLTEARCQWYLNSAPRRCLRLIRQWREAHPDLVGDLGILEVRAWFRLDSQRALELIPQLSAIEQQNPDLIADRSRYAQLTAVSLADARQALLRGDRKRAQGTLRRLFDQSLSVQELCATVLLALQLSPNDYAWILQTQVEQLALTRLLLAGHVYKQGQLSAADTLLRVPLPSLVAAVQAPWGASFESYRAQAMWVLAQLRQEDAQVRQQLLTSLRNWPSSCVERGMAWVVLAQTLSGDAAIAAWCRAAADLPLTHPWLLPALRQGPKRHLQAVAAGTVLQQLDSEQRQLLQTAVQLLLPLAGAGIEDKHLQARFWLMQALAQLGQRSAARAHIHFLLEHATGDQRQRLRQSLQRLSR